MPFVVRPEPRSLRVPIMGDPSRLDAVRQLTTSANAREVLSQAVDADSLLEALVTFAAVQELDLTAARIGRRFLPAEVAAVAWRTPEISGIAGGVSDPDPKTLVTIPVAQLGGRTLFGGGPSPPAAGRPGPRRPARVPGRPRRLGCR